MSEEQTQLAKLNKDGWPDPVDYSDQLGRALTSQVLSRIAARRAKEDAEEGYFRDWPDKDWRQMAADHYVKLCDVRGGRETPEQLEDAITFLVLWREALRARELHLEAQPSKRRPWWKRLLGLK